MTNDLVRRLATSQARGVRQMSFINELLVGIPVRYKLTVVPGSHETTIYGESELARRSWNNLKRRLVSVGFLVLDKKDSKTITLKFPENPIR